MKGMMTPTLFVVIFVAVNVAVCSGQTSTSFAPKSDCGVFALKCFTDSKKTMDDKFDAIDFAGACQIYKTILMCMTGAGDCETDVDYQIVLDELNADQDGICGVDGSINSCGYDVQQCFNEMDSAVADALIKNFTNACPLVVKFVKCAKGVLSTTECPTSLTTRITTLEQSLSNDQDSFGCDGRCPQAVALCSAGAEAKPGNESILTLNITKYCSSASKVYTCLNNLQTSAACATSSQSYMKDIAQNELAAIGDLCNSDGSISNCVTSLVQCAADLASVQHGSNTATQCKAASEFLECISRLPCATTLTASIIALRNTVETVEIELTCPSVGSCNDRWALCAHNDEGLQNVTSQNKAQVCNTAKTARTCFNYVTSDPLCINEKNSYITRSQEINMLFKVHCGNASSWFIQLPLLVAALLVSLRLYL